MPPKKQANAADKKQDGMPVSGALFAQYDAWVQEGKIKDDPAQRMVVGYLQSIKDSLSTQGKRKPKGLFDALLGKKSALHGLYVWGNVGRGKSMLMDLFFTHAPVDKKRRVHFHAFMQEVHARIHALRREGKGDPVSILAHEIAQATTLLCFDELQATDVADATLLYRLFDRLFDAGVLIVSTSNRPPIDLYTGGVQRERFANFVRLLEDNMEVISLSSPEDYRYLQQKGLHLVYFYPLGEDANIFIGEVLDTLGAKTDREETIVVQGRELKFWLYNKDIGRFSFYGLCESALGPADYLAIAKRLKTVILTDIPRLPAEKRNEAKRFVTLVDALYEAKVKLICTADVPPHEIYAHGDGSFEFARTVSRLMEMQSQKYIQD